MSKNEVIMLQPHYSRYVYRRLTRLVPSVFIFILLASGPLMRWILPRYGTLLDRELFYQSRNLP